MSQKEYFFSFEMIFGNGEKALGNVVKRYGPITREDDITNVETYIKQSLNAGNIGRETHIDVVTLINWKVL